MKFKFPSSVKSFCNKASNVCKMPKKQIFFVHWIVYVTLSKLSNNKICYSCFSLCMELDITTTNLGKELIIFIWVTLGMLARLVLLGTIGKYCSKNYLPCERPSNNGWHWSFSSCYLCSHSPYYSIRTLMHFLREVFLF